MIDIQTIKSWFQRGMKPTAAQFAAVFDSYRHKSETLQTSDINNLDESLAEKTTANDVEAIIKEKSFPFLTLSKIDAFLWEIRYDHNNIDYDYAKQHFTNELNPHIIGGCSSVRNGNLYGRNLDWYYDNQVDFVIKTNSAKGRYASIGVASVTGITDADMLNGYDAEKFKLLPFKIVDGINEKGLICSVNVVPSDMGTTNQYRGKERMPLSMVVKYVLDYHSTARTALEDIRNNFDVFANAGQEVHFMCADYTGTYVLEYVDNIGIVIDISDKPVMTNFHLLNVEYNQDGTLDWSSIEDHGMGLERYDLICTLLANGISVRDFMHNHLKYSNAYTNENSLYWKTEFTGVTETFGDITIHSTDEKFMPVITEGRARYAEGRNGGAWITCHTSVYDMLNMVLYIHTQEGDTEFRFELDPHYCEIDDTTTTTEKTWSSSKINSAIVANKPVWGSIEGDLHDQTDLQEALTAIEAIADTADQKADTVLAGLEGKVDKVEGKGLSANDFTDEEKQKLSDSIIDVEVNDTSVVDEGKVAHITLPAVIDNTSTQSATNPLSANMGANLQEQINNLKARGRYLSVWDCTAGLATTTPTVAPYTYKTGDYFIVGIIGDENYKPDGETYSESTPSTALETGNVKVNDTYYYDGSVWTLLSADMPEISFASLAGNPTDNTNLANTLNDKANQEDLNTVQGTANTALSNANQALGGLDGKVSKVGDSLTGPLTISTNTNIMIPADAVIKVASEGGLFQNIIDVYLNKSRTEVLELLSLVNSSRKMIYIGKANASVDIIVCGGIDPSIGSQYDLGSPDTRFRYIYCDDVKIYRKYGTSAYQLFSPIDSHQLQEALASIEESLVNKEDSDNKVTTLSSNNTDNQYPSAKCVYDTLCHTITFNAQKDSDGVITLNSCDTDFNTLYNWISNNWKVECKLRIRDISGYANYLYEGNIIKITPQRAGYGSIDFDFCLGTDNSIHKHIYIKGDSNGYNITEITNYQPKLTAGTGITIDSNNVISSTNSGDGNSGMSFMLDGSALSTAFRKIEIIHIRNNSSDSDYDDCYKSRIDDHNFAILGGIATYKIEIKTTDNNGSQYSQWCFNIIRPNTNNGKLIITYTGSTSSPTLMFNWQ